MKKFILKNVKIIILSLGVVATILIGALIGIILVYQKGFPQIKNLEELKPMVMTTVFNDQNGLIREFAIEKRTIVRFSDIPQSLKQALIAAEDTGYYSHWGISFKGIFRALFGVIFKQNRGGGSTITMQLARNLFLYDERTEKTFSRKLKEILLAIQIEKKYSKDQIMTFYCNKIPFGGNAYGVEAASQYYFGKSVRDIDIAESALLSSVIPSPNGRFNVFRNPENCRRRRAMVLKKMLEQNFITQKQHEEALKVKLPEKPSEFYREMIGDHFLEEVRKYIEDKFGDTLLYQGGLRVYTTLNSEMQKWAEDALREGLRRLDKRRGWRIREKLPNVLSQKLNIDRYSPPSWEKFQVAGGKIVEGIILKVDNTGALVRIKNFRGRLAAGDAAWTRKPLATILKRGDIALFKILDTGIDLDIYLKKAGTAGKVDLTDKKYEMKLALEQEPEVQGAMLVVDNKTGAIKAMVGGYSFERSKWNNATQAKRQPGSSFKPIVYSAALENGYTLNSIVEDEYFSDFDVFTEELWEPHNYPPGFKGSMTLRRAFELSRNVVTARLAKELTPERIVRYGKRFGLTSELKPYIAIALGSFEVTLQEMVAAFTVFPNLGIRVEPHFIKTIRDEHNVIDGPVPERKQVLEKEIAYLMNYLMQGVVKSGTGYRARGLNAPIGGKTGTTDDFTNAWFIGFSPSLTVGVWVGFEASMKRLGEGETGGEVACPIFTAFMEKYLEKYPEPQEYNKPANILLAKIDKFTGKLYTDNCLHAFWEAFISGTEPTDYCTDDDHSRFRDYYGDEERSAVGYD